MQVKIYLITNQINGKKYVGQTSRTLARRFWEHANNLKYAIGQAMQKYGIENFTIELIEVCATREQANERERYWIAFHDCIAPNCWLPLQKQKNWRTPNEGHAKIMKAVAKSVASRAAKRANQNK